MMTNNFNIIISKKNIIILYIYLYHYYKVFIIKKNIKITEY